jgi:hypothetical protein
MNFPRARAPAHSASNAAFSHEKHKEVFCE